MTDPHHDATHDDQRGRSKTKFLSTQQRGNDNIAASLQLAVRLNDDAVAQPIKQQGLLRFRQAQLPRRSGMLERSQRRSASAAVVATDQDHI